MVFLEQGSPVRFRHDRWRRAEKSFPLAIDCCALLVRLCFLCCALIGRVVLVRLPWGLFSGHLYFVVQGARKTAVIGKGQIEVMSESLSSLGSAVLKNGGLNESRLLGSFISDPASPVPVGPFSVARLRRMWWGRRGVADVDVFGSVAGMQEVGSANRAKC